MGWRSASVSYAVASLTASTCFAFAGGATSSELLGPAGCANCHAPNTPSATGAVYFDNPPVVGVPVRLVVVVLGPGPGAGYLLTMDDGTLMAGSGSRSAGRESTQNATLTAPASWAVFWTPSAPGPVGYTMWPIIVDGDGTVAGDHPRSSPLTGTVTVRLPQGAACTDGAACGSGFCVDGVCCDTACGGPCVACALAAQGAVDGTCTPLTGVDCVAGATCGDDPAAPFFTCTCPPGSVGSGRSASGGCADVNECASHPCAQRGDRDDNGGEDGQGCTQIPLGSWLAPGYTCSCQPGYAQGGSPRSCVINDECTSGVDDCDASPAAVCSDPNPAPTSLGDYTCTCPGPGWANDPVRQGRGVSGCVDVDECQNGFAGCDSNATCTNTPGSFTCTCNGPTWADAGGTGGQVCVDADECALGTHGCDPHATCTNAAPGFACACAAGYEDAPGTSGGVQCVNVDECALGSDDCDPNATCTDVVGGYLCECNPGFGGSGAQCEDVDECALGLGGCRADELCENRVGAPYACVCPPGASRDAQGLCAVICGDGVVADTEACDDGAANSDTAPDACRTDCQPARCGDGVVDTGETCDDGTGAGDPAECQCTADAGVAVDAGAVIEADAGPVDGGQPGAGRQVDEGGCGCRAGAPESGTPALGMLLVLIALAAAWAPPALSPARAARAAPDRRPPAAGSRRQRARLRPRR